MELNKAEIKKILDEKKKELGVIVPPKTLMQFLMTGYKKWLYKHRLEKALKKSKKDLQKEREQLKNSTQTQREIFDETARVFKKSVLKSVPDWVLELPLDRVSESCRQQIRELILVDINEHLEELSHWKEALTNKNEWDKSFEQKIADTFKP